MSRIPDENQSSGGNGIDFNEYIGRKQVIGINERQQGAHH